MIVDVLVEGPTDEAVARKLIRYCGHEFGTGFGKQGFAYLQSKISGFAVRAAYGNPMLVLVDFMDTGLACPPAVPAGWLPEQSSKIVLRVVERELESWLLADRRGLASYLGVSEARIPGNPEHLPDPKRQLVNLARRSRRRRILEDIVPVPGVSSVVGPGYTSAILDFVTTVWSVDAASANSLSLQRCILSGFLVRFI